MAVEHDEQRDDPWASARAAQRDDVRSVLAPRERRCPSCGAVQHGRGRRCHECGADLTARESRWRSLPKLAIAAVIAVVIAAAAVPLVSALRDDAADEGARQA